MMKKHNKLIYIYDCGSGHTEFYFYSEYVKIALISNRIIYKFKIIPNFFLIPSYINNWNRLLSAVRGSFTMHYSILSLLKSNPSICIVLAPAISGSLRVSARYSSSSCRQYARSYALPEYYAVDSIQSAVPKNFFLVMRKQKLQFFNSIAAVPATAIWNVNCPPEGGIIKCRSLIVFTILFSFNQSNYSAGKSYFKKKKTISNFYQKLKREDILILINSISSFFKTELHIILTSPIIYKFEKILLLPEFIQLYLYATYTKKEQIKIVPSSSVKSTYLFKQKKKSTITFSRFINLWTKEMGKTTLYNVKQITTLNNNINIDLFFNEFINNSSKNLRGFADSGGFASNKFAHFYIYNFYRFLIFNLISAIKKGFQRGLSLRGAGYRLYIHLNLLILKVGYTFFIFYQVPYEFKLFRLGRRKRKLLIYSYNKELVSSLSYNLLNLRIPSVYTGKGIRLRGAFFLKKAGKGSLF